jgi:hypothetical protein
MLNITGIHLIKGDKNSASKRLVLEGRINTELSDQKEVPGPIIISLNNQPIKILPNAKMTKGIDILAGDS